MQIKEVKHVTGNGAERTFLRLYADDHKVLTNDDGKTVWNCVDVDSADGWIEIDLPEDEEEEPIDQETIDKAEAFDIIFGGAE